MFRAWIVAFLCFALGLLAIARPASLGGRGPGLPGAEERQAEDEEAESAKELAKLAAAPAPRHAPRGGSAASRATARVPLDALCRRTSNRRASLRPVPAEMAGRNGAGVDLRC